MSADENTQAFLQKMDAGDFDGMLFQEVKKLSKEQLEELTKILIERDVERES